MRNDMLKKNSAISLVNRHMSDLKDEIDLEEGGACLSSGIEGETQFGELEGQWRIVKELINIHKKDSARILDTVIPQHDILTKLALGIPECLSDDGSADNVNGRIAGPAGAASFLTCSYLGHPVMFNDGKHDVTGLPEGTVDCPIDPDILDLILPPPP